MAQIPESGLSGSQCDMESEIIAEATDSDYGLTGVFAPLDPRNYSGEDGLKSQETGLINLLIGGVLLVGGGSYFVDLQQEKASHRHFSISRVSDLQGLSYIKRTNPV